MSTTLTTGDLQAIKGIVKETVTTAINAAIEESDQRTAAGFAQIDERFAQVDNQFAQIDKQFADVHAKIDDITDDLGSVKQTVERIERVQCAEIERVDHQESAINKMRKALKAV